jgi:ribose 5-phosphate isomerase B
MINIAGDHHTVDLLTKIENYLTLNSIEFKNVGTMDSNVKISLQEIIHAVTIPIQRNENDSGILVCGTGAGVEIGANRFKGIRATLCTLPKQAEFAKVYDNANVLCLSSWITEDPVEILESWFNNLYDGNEKRTQMIKDFDTWN